MNGILNIDKPRGWTSFAVVAAVKRSCGERHAGHAGTLDPIATGVLPICLGKSTRVIEYLMDTVKTYRTEIGFGKSTDTFDAEGRTVKTADISSITLPQIEAVLSQFRGEIQQVPPVYSAVKMHGKPLYRYTREGTIVNPAGRTVTIHELDVLDWQPPVITLRIICSRGTYIRSLANDIGEKLECGAYMQSLVREKYGPFDIKEAVSITQLEEFCRAGIMETVLYPADTVLMNMPAMVLNEDDARVVINGGDLDVPRIAQSSMYCRAYSAGGTLAAVLRYKEETSSWHPEKVFLNNDQ